MSGKTYFLLQPLNFGAFVGDTGDLSTLRGASITLLRTPDLVLDWLTDRFGSQYHIDILQNAASELFVTLAANADQATGAEAYSVPDGVDERRWKGAYNSVRNSNPVKKAAAANTLTDNILRAPVARAVRNLGNEEALAERLKAQIKGHFTPSTRALTDAEIADLRRQTRGFLAAQQGDYPLDLMSFGLEIASVPETLDVLSARARLETLIRRAQLRNWTIPLPAPGTSIDAQSAVCSLTKCLPAHPKETKLQNPISLSVARRRRVGLRGKEGFYGAELKKAQALWQTLSEKKLDQTIASSIGDIAPIERAISLLETGTLKGGFAKEFQDIVAHSTTDLPVSLRNGICVLHMDGNKFGASREAAISSHGAAGLRAHSLWLELRKALFLADILIWIAEDPATRMHEGKAAFETLLWGGDEFCFVLPAWCGWDFACLISIKAAAWKDPFRAKTLSFAVGMAFGKAKTPIRLLIRAADDAGGLCKATSREETLFFPVAYESVDSVALSPSAFYQQRFGPDFDLSRLALTTEAIRQATGNLAHLEKQAGLSGLIGWMVAHRAQFAQMTTQAADDVVAQSAQHIRSALETRMGRVSGARSPQPDIFVPRVNDDAGKMVSLALGLILKDYVRSQASAP